MEDVGNNADRGKSLGNRGQLKLWAIILVAATPVILASVMYFGKFGIPQGSTNKGTLVLPPISSEQADVKRPDDATDAFTQIDGKQKWLMLIVGDGTCDKRCIEGLYLTRQVNIALGKEAGRVTRLLLTDEPNPELVSALQEHPKLLSSDYDAKQRENLETVLAEYEVQLKPYDILIMDPLGNIMMHYSDNHSGKDILEDLKRLLKVSKIG